MELAALGLRIDARGAIRTLNQYSSSASNAGRATEKFERTTKNLTASLAALGGFFGIRQLVEYADTWTLISARIGITAKSTEEMMTIQSRLFDISQRTRNTLAATAVLYTRVALNADQLGRSSEELLTVVESVNAALLISGATGVEAAQSMRQFAQALGKGVLDGDELRTVLEAMPLVARAIADEMGVAVGALKDLGAKGLINVQVIFDALIKRNKEWQEQIDKMPFTIGQAFEIMNNALVRMVGIINTAKGVSATFGKSLIAISKNIDKVIAAVALLISSLVAYKVAIIAAAAWTQLLTAGATVRAFLTLAISVRRLADAGALLSMMAGGLKSILAFAVAAGVGLGVYLKILEEITKATEEWINANADLTAPFGERVDLVTPSTRAALRRVEDMIREANQAIVLAGLSEEMQARQEIAYDAVNQRVKARRDLEGDIQQAMLGAINLEERLAIVALEVAEAFEAQTEAIEDQQRIIDRFLRNIQESFAQTFADIFEGGLEKFDDLFKGIKRLFIRLLAEMAAAKLIQSLGPSLNQALSGIFGVSSQQAVLDAQVAAAIAIAQQSASAAVLGGQAGLRSQGEGFGKVPVEIEGITVTAARSWARFIGPALAGFVVGQIIGGSTTNRALGTFGGGLGGAATGFATGGPIGALVGGLAGAIGGFISSSNRLRGQLEANRLVLERNNITLQGMRDAFEGATNRQLLAARDILQTTMIGRRVRNIPDLIDFRIFERQAREVLEAIAASLNITILNAERMIIPGTLTQLAEAIEEAIRALTQFGNTLSDVRQRQDAFNRLFDIEQTPGRKLQDTFNLLNELAPNLLQQLGLSNINLESATGRSVFLEGLREIFNMIARGDFTDDPALLGAFADKDQLIDAILRAKDALDEFNKVLFNATTDFPRAMDIAFYEQRFGRFGVPKGSFINVEPTTTGFHDKGDTWQIGSIYITNESGDTGQDILKKLEDAVITRRGRGGSVDLDRTAESLF